METSETSPYSHPDQPIRHSYPLAIEKAGIGTAMDLLIKTFPYAVVRFGILVAVSLITILWFGGTVGIGAWLGESVHPWIGAGWFIGGFGIYGYFWFTVVRYFLYLLKCGHIAVITELITKNQIGNGGENMFTYGKNVVTARFKEVNVLFAMDLLIAGVVKAFNNTLDFIGALLPIPGLQNVTKVVGMVLHAMTTYIDETLFSYNLARGDENPWRAGKDGLIYYAQNAKEILKTSIGIVLLEKLLVGLVWILFLLPAFGLARLVPNSNVTIAAFFFAALFAWNIKAAFLHPLFLIMIMSKFHVSVQGQEINETWDARLDKVSGKFGQIKEKIREWHRNKTSSAPAAEPPLEGATPAA